MKRKEEEGRGGTGGLYSLSSEGGGEQCSNEAMCVRPCAEIARRHGCCKDIHKPALEYIPLK